jgi:hypothetical protein
MPRFGERLRRGSGTDEQSPPETEPVPAEPSAQERLDALLAEQVEVERELGDHRTLRERWMVDGALAGSTVGLRERFCSPPAAQFNPWVFSQFVSAVERSRSTPAEVVEATIIPAPSFGLRLPRDPWKPLYDGRVPPDLIEAISPLAPDRQVRFRLRVNIFKVQPGYTTVEAGTEMWLSARAAFACNYVGAAEYIDVAQSAEAPAA